IGAGTATALTFAGDPSHARYAGKLPIATTARLIAQGEGWKGTSRGYLAGTVGAVRRMGRRPEPGLDHLLAAVRAINGEGPISRAR
ncbi:MAG: gamma-glutamylcyclotransferase, partial [Alphaproteobacteria bacterium]|nr:gamma-glutamylcyclotransferase [Alphaproteobacteria bacterium]